MAYQWTPEAKQPLSVEIYSSQKENPTLKGFKSDLSTHNHKEVILDLDCNSETALSTTKLPGGFLEYVCMVDIGAYPMTSQIEKDDKTKTPAVSTPNDNMGATYELSYEIAGVHSLLYPNHMTVVNLLPDEERLFQFNIHEQAAEADSLDFILQMSFGKTEMNVSKLERNPCKPASASNVSQIFTLTSGENKFKTMRFGKGGILINDLQGSYYVCVKSMGVMSSLLLMPSPSIGKNSLFTSMDAGLLHLPPNHQLVGEITEDDASLEFNFNLNLDPKEDEVINVNVSPISGSNVYRIAASASGFAPNPHQEFWNVIGNTLSISSKDPLFKPKGEYRVRITIPSKNEYKAEGHHRFSVSYTIGLKDILLKEGLPYVGDLRNHTNGEHRFRIEIPPGTNNLTLLKSYIDHHYSIDCMIQSSNQSNKESNFTISEYQGSKIFDSVMLESFCPGLATTSCNLYLKIYNNVSQSTYLIAYSLNNSPFTIHQGYGYNLPPSLDFGIYQLHFNYHLSSKHKNITLDCENPYAVMRCFVKYAKESEIYNYPSRTSFNKVLIGEYSTADIGPDDYKDNDLILITVELAPITDIKSIFDKLTHNYIFALKGKIMVNAGARKLIVGKPYKGKILEKQWKYFHLHHKSGENVVVNFESSFSSCRLFISKGFNSIVSFNNHLVSSYSYQEKTLVVTPEVLRRGDTIMGYYTLGVHCFSNATIRLLYKASYANNYELRLNDPTKIDVVPDSNTYVEFLNYGPDEDVEIDFRAPKAGVTLLLSVFDPQTMLLANELNNKEFKAPSMPTIEKYDFGTNFENPIYGYGKLKIPKTSDRYCRLCRMVMLIKVTEPDSVELIIKKSSAAWPAPLFEGEEQFALLKTNEVAFFEVEAIRFHENVPATVHLHSGHILIDVSSKSFENVTDFSTMPSEELKGVNKLVDLEEEPQDRFTLAKMYIRIKAVNDSKISLSYAENLVRQELLPNNAFMSTIGPSFTKILAMKTEDVEAVHGSLTVTAFGTYEVKDINDDLLKHAVSKGFLSVYSANNMIDVDLGKYYEVPTHLRIDKDRNRIEFKFEPNSKVAVIKLKNYENKLIHFNIETSTKEITYVKPKERIVSALHQFAPYQVYTIPVPHERSVFKLDVHECVEHLVVQANFYGRGQSSETSVIMFDQYVDERQFPLNDGPGTLKLYFFMRGAYERNLALSFVKEKAEKQPVPTVFSFTFDIETQGDPNRIKPEQFSIRNEVGEVQVHDLSGQVTVKKVMIDNMDKLLETHNIQVVYSLVLARNIGMMNHLLRCGKYALSDAKHYFNTDDFSVLNYYDHITKESVAEKKRKESENKYLKVESDNEVILNPSMYAFGDPYQAAVVARVYLYGKYVRFSDSGHLHVPRGRGVHPGVRAVRLRRQRGGIHADGLHGVVRAALFPRGHLAVRQERPAFPSHEKRLVQHLRLGFDC